MTDTITLLAVGDIMLGDHPVCLGHGIRSTIERNGFNYLFSKISSRLIGHDIVFGNLETALSTNTIHTNSIKSMELIGKPEYAKQLSHLGFNVLSVSNNHAMQHGIKAFNETVHTLKENKITPVGIISKEQKSNIFYLIKNDIKIALISYSLRPEKFSPNEVPYAVGSESRVIEQTKQLFNSCYQVIVSLHWGEEYLNDPSPYQIMLGRKLIDNGASLIIGHHPHVLQPIEKYKHGYIAYSLGNFIFDKWQKNPRETILLNCTFTNTGINNIFYQPVYINKKYQPEIPSKRITARIESKINSDKYLFASIETKNIDFLQTKYVARAKKAYTKFRLQSYLYFITHIYKYKTDTVFQSLKRFIRRRIGIE